MHCYIRRSELSAIEGPGIWEVVGFDSDEVIWSGTAEQLSSWLPSKDWHEGTLIFLGAGIAYPGMTTMPANRYNLQNGDKVYASNNYPFLDVMKDEPMTLWFDGKFVVGNGRTWHILSICEEIDAGLWYIKQEDE
jgi:hypothetical protein